MEMISIEVDLIPPESVLFSEKDKSYYQLLSVRNEYISYILSYEHFDEYESDENFICEPRFESMYQNSLETLSLICDLIAKKRNKILIFRRKVLEYFYQKDDSFKTFKFVCRKENKKKV